MKKIYISGKISGLDAGMAEEKFTESWRKQMRLKKYLPLDPFMIKPLFGIDEWIFHMIADILVLLKCDAILLQPDWIDSRGSKIEVVVAILTRKQIIIEK
jgi:hypothetical protein